MEPNEQRDLNKTEIVILILMVLIPMLLNWLL